MSGLFIIIIMLKKEFSVRETEINLDKNINIYFTILDALELENVIASILEERIGKEKGMLTRCN